MAAGCYNPSEMQRRAFFSIVTGLAARVLAWASPEKNRTADRPKQIYLIRHGEKTGSKTDIHLNARGFERAAALAGLFPTPLDTPDVLFASKQSARSNRPVETVRPLARALRLAIVAEFANEAYLALARVLLTQYAGKTVLVCWHHGNLPALADALGAGDIPAWPDSQFDRLWRIRYDAEGNVLFENLPQRLLQGDS